MNDCRFFVLNFKVSFKRYQTLNWPFSLLSIIIRQPEKRSEYQTLVLNDRPFGNALAVSFFRRCARLRLCAYDFHCSIQKRRGKLGRNVSFNECLVLYRETELQQNARPFGSSMAERLRFDCLDTWPCNCKQISSLWFPIDTFGQLW